MSHSVNIENYESFYLDFIEGNLNAFDTTALMEFLERNPHLIVDDEAFVYLSAPDHVAFDSDLKAELKFPDTAQKIGINNIDTFLIASVENQLSAKKSAELSVFLEANPLYYEDLSLYQRSRLQADLGIVYPSKKALKKGGFIVPMYVRFAAIAACAVIAFTIYRSENFQPTNLAFGDKTVKYKKPKKLTGHQTEAPKLVEEKQGVDVGTTKRYVTAIDVSTQIPAETNGAVADRNSGTARLKIKTAKNFPAHLPDLADPMNVEMSEIAQVSKENRSEVDMVAMKNPIEPITNRISELINKQVDFKTSKAAQKKSGGFYLKIGRFELSRKLYDKRK